MENARSLQATAQQVPPRAIGSAAAGLARPVVVSASSPPQIRPFAAGSQPPSATCFHNEVGTEIGALAFGPVPSREEVSEAITAINQMFSPVTLSGIIGEESSFLGMESAVKSASATGKTYKVSSDISQAESTLAEMKPYNTRTVDIIDAFRSLQINPSIQRMVTSLSTDKAVWNAVMKNTAVKELRNSFGGVFIESIRRKNTEPGSNIVETILDWILQVTKMKILELLGKLWKIAIDIFCHKDMAKTVILKEAVSSAFMLAVVVFIVVVAFRVFRSQ